MGYSYRSMFLRDGGGGTWIDEFVDGAIVAIDDIPRQEIYKPTKKKVTKNITNNTLNIFAGNLPNVLKGLIQPSNNGNNGNNGKPQKNNFIFAGGKKSVPKHIKSKIDDYIAKMSKRGFQFARNNYEVPGEVEVLMKDCRTGNLVPKYFNY